MKDDNAKALIAYKANLDRIRSDVKETKLCILGEYTSITI